MKEVESEYSVVVNEDYDNDFVVFVLSKNPSIKAGQNRVSNNLNVAFVVVLVVLVVLVVIVYIVVVIVVVNFYKSTFKVWLKSVQKQILITLSLWWWVVVVLIHFRVKPNFCVELWL